ncbi:MAG: zinc ABC transporter substrate-binding protein [Planctomycetaceae bacterium]|nr:zinc ABC transporter substrate-binding protein [Planctomycetaceae bacterium]
MIRKCVPVGRLVLVAILCLAALPLSSPARAGDADTADGRLRVVASRFAQYDFARQIAGALADVTLLLPPGAESHSFEPTPADMRRIAEADLFIYTGAAMEPWADRLSAAATDSGRDGAAVTVVDASAGIPLLASGALLHGGEEEPRVHDDHDHAEHGNGNDNHDVHAGHAHGAFDPHIWLDPTRAATMAVTIGAALAARDPANAATYQDRAAAVRDELLRLDAAFTADVATAGRRPLVFGERFAFAYFFQHYGLRPLSPYISCAPGAEPGLRAVLDVVNEMKKENLRVVYREEMSASRIANVLVEETGAEILLVDSLHNPPASRQAGGETFQSIMGRNMDAFRKGLRE